MRIGEKDLEKKKRDRDRQARVLYFRQLYKWNYGRVIPDRINGGGRKGKRLGDGGDRLVEKGRKKNYIKLNFALLL